LLDASSGSASVAGFDAAKSPIEVRRRIGYVPQMLSADDGLTTTENLVLSTSLYALLGAERYSRIRDPLSFAGLEAVADQLAILHQGRLEVVGSPSISRARSDPKPA